MIILSFICILILALVFLYCFLEAYKNFLKKRTDIIIDKYFNTTDIWKDIYNVNNDNLAIQLGDKLFVVKQIKLWQIKSLNKVFTDNDFDIDKIVNTNEFLVALAIMFSKKDDIPGSYKLGYYIGQYATIEQLNRAIRVIIIKNNFLSLLTNFKTFMKENNIV